MPSLKSAVRAGLKSVGLELRKLRSHHTDPLGDITRLLGDATVRTAFDVGAFEGDAAHSYRTVFPDATVYCFEPTSASFDRLQRRFAGDAKVITTRAAIGQTPGHATLHINVFDQTNSLLPISGNIKNFVAQGQDKELATETVPVIAVGDFCRTHNLGSIDLLKLDIQGFELGALKGARGLLERRAIRLIFTEVLFAPHYQGQCFYHEIAAYLAGFGYELYGLYALMRGRNGVLSQADAIFMSPQVRERI
jgi:FkbM family methyltransferase